MKWDNKRHFCAAENSELFRRRSTRLSMTVWNSFREPLVNQLSIAEARGPTVPQTLVMAADDCSQKRYRRAACHTPAQDSPED